MEVQELMKYMLDFFNNINKKLSIEKDKLSAVDRELSDLDHYIENHTLKCYEHSKASKLRQDLRKERRQIKNNIDFINTVKVFADKYNNKMITGDIIKNLKDQETLEKRQSNPTYTYKTNILEKLKGENK